MCGAQLLIAYATAAVAQGGPIKDWVGFSMSEVHQLLAYLLLGDPACVMLGWELLRLDAWVTCREFFCV